MLDVALNVRVRFVCRVLYLTWRALCWMCRVREQPETEEEAAAIREKERKRVEENLQTVKDRSKVRVCYAVGYAIQ